MSNSKRVDIKIGFQCNNSCRFCIQGDKRNKFPNKTAEEVKNILKKEKNNCDSVLFTGGEPTIQKNLVDYVKYAKGRLFAYKDYCIELIKAGVDVFNPAIHGSCSEIHDYLTRSPGSFKQTLKGIKNLKKLNQIIGTQTVITKINYQDIPNIAKMMIDLKPNFFQFAFMHINPIIQENPQLIEEIVPRYSQVESYVKEGLQIGVNAGVETRTEAITYCFMKGYESHITGNKTPTTTVYDANKIIENFNEVRKTQGKSKGPNCQRCKYDEICEGPWRDYPEIFGWEEFKPIKY
ncbi:MAG: radical SAM protein [Candidatus Nealsonbacteria bacterium]|nr:radical SAM protein [Candidatus Nealsonbacteria bacterium]